MSEIFQNIYIIAFFAMLLLLLSSIIAFLFWYKKPKLGTAIVRTGVGGSKVCFEKGIFVIPILHKNEIMDIKLQTIEIEHTGINAINIGEGIKAEIKVLFFIKISRNHHHVIEVASIVGCERAMMKETLQQLFALKFSEAVKEAAISLGTNCSNKPEYRILLLNIIGHYLDGYTLNDCSVEYVNVIQVPVLN